MTIDDLKRRRLDIRKEVMPLIHLQGSLSNHQRNKLESLMSEIGELDSTILDFESGEMSALARRKLEPPLRPGARDIEYIDPDEPFNAFADPHATAQMRTIEFRSNPVKLPTRDNSPEAKAVRNFLRSGYNGERYGLPSLSDEDRHLLRHERRDMGIGSPTSSIPTSVLVPQGFYHDIEVALKYYGPMMDVSKIITTATGQPLPYPTANDTTQVASIVGEGANVAEDDVTVGNLIFGAWKLSSGLVKVSLELLQDSAFDLETFLKERFAERFGRGLNTLFTNGTGSSEPTGFMTVATAGPTAVGSSGNTGGSETGGTSVGTDDLVALEHAVDPWYRTGAIYMMNDDTLKRIKQLKDKFGRPIYESPKDGLPALLNGYPFRINNDLPTIAVNAKTVYFGRFDKYIIRRVKEMAVIRLVERFADYGQVAFIAFARYDGNLVDAGTHPIKCLVQAAS